MKVEITEANIRGIVGGLVALEMELQDDDGSSEYAATRAVERNLKALYDKCSGPRKEDLAEAEGHVWCVKHGAIHDDTTDPYDYDEADCETTDHRTVFWRKGEGDE